METAMMPDPRPRRGGKACAFFRSVGFDPDLCFFMRFLC